MKPIIYSLELNTSSAVVSFYYDDKAQTVKTYILSIY
jgi:hypothetical protein